MRMFVVLGLFLWVGIVSAGVSAMDDRGRRVVLAGPATRIVSLAPHVTELLFAAGAGTRVVGVVAYSDYPLQAQRLPLVGDAARIDVEAVLALRPDLIVGWASGNPQADLERLEGLGVPVFITEPRLFEDVARDLEQLGRLAGTAPYADRVAAELRTGVAALRRTYAQRTPVRVFYQIWPRPVSTVGGGHVISEVLGLCGGRNVFGALTALAPAVSEEAVLEADPEAILAGAEAGAGEPFAVWRRWPRLTAVRAGNLYTIPADYLHRQTPRLLLGARAVCARLDEARKRLGKN